MELNASREPSFCVGGQRFTPGREVCVCTLNGIYYKDRTPYPRLPPPFLSWLLRRVLGFGSGPPAPRCYHGQNASSAPRDANTSNTDECDQRKKKKKRHKRQKRGVGFGEVERKKEKKREGKEKLSFCTVMVWGAGLG